MIFVGNPHAVQLTIRQQYRNLPLVNVLTFDYGAVPTAGDVAGVAEKASVAWGEEMAPHLSGGHYTLGFTARSLESPESPVAVYDYPEPLNGGGGDGIPGPSAQALCITMYTAIPGRSGRGRLYLGGVHYDNSNANYANQNWATGARNGFAAFASAMENAGAGVLSVYSRRYGGEPRATGRLAHVTQITLRNLRIDSQRRRSPKD
jgi:hypothetical protein